MKRVDRQAAFGPTPEAFARRLEDALQQAERPVKRKPAITFALAALLVLALACTALAVAHQLGLLDMLPHYHPETSGDASGLIQTEIEQTGGETEIATFTVREAAYIGNMVRVTVAIMPKDENTALVSESAMTLEYELNEAAPYGDEIWGASCHETSLWTVYTVERIDREGAGLLWSFGFSLDDENAPDELPITMSCATYAPGTWIAAEDAVPLTFTLTREPAPETLALDVDIDMLGGARMKHIALTRSPIEIHAVFTFEAEQDSFPMFELINADGTLMQGGGGVSDYDPNTKLYRSDSTWAAQAEMPDTLYVLMHEMLSTKTISSVAVIDLATGKAAVYPATIIDTPEQRTIEF